MGLYQRAGVYRPAMKLVVLSSVRSYPNCEGVEADSCKYSISFHFVQILTPSCNHDLDRDIKPYPSSAQITISGRRMWFYVLSTFLWAWYICSFRSRQRFQRSVSSPISPNCWSTARPWQWIIYVPLSFVHRLTSS
jgi:hypothetical protein